MNEKGKEIFILLYDFDNWSQDGMMDFQTQVDASQYIDAHQHEWNEYRLIKGTIMAHHNLSEERIHPFS
jgi:hypothetical protein